MNYDRIILELMDRVATLEDEVRALKAERHADSLEAVPSSFEADSPIYNGRDKTKYILNGVRYGKNRLVLAIVTEYFKNNPSLTAAELIATFDRSLQGSLGVIRTFDDVSRNYTDYEKRFFCQPDEVIYTSTGRCVVCTQWGVGNIGNVIARAKELGINVTVI